MREKIWYEMVDKKFGEIYLTKYLGFQRTLKRSFQILTLIVSLSGILSWKYFENFVWVAFILIAIIQIFLLVENQLIRSDKEIEEISRLKMMYTKYFHKLEELWTEYSTDEIKEEKARKSFFQMRKKDWRKIEELDGKLNIKKYKRTINATEKETNNYLKKYHSHE